MSDNDMQVVTWKVLLAKPYGSKIATLVLAVWLHAANSMLTATTMPSAVDEIGGLNLISWTFALYLMGSIIAGAVSSLFVNRYGLRSTMIRAAILYGVGCVICAAAPSMPVVLVGRTLQGLGGGGLVALVYISQDRFFPNHFVPKVVACISMVWMLSAFCGPVIGGAFSTWSSWRYAYWAFAFQSILLVFAIQFLLRKTTSRPEPEIENISERIPFVRLSYLAISILSVSFASAQYHYLWSPVLIVAGLMFLVLFVFRDKTAASSRMLPRDATNLSHRMGNGIMTTFLFCISIMSFLVYGPLILIKLYGLTPFHAGLVVMMETLAWGTFAIIFSSSQNENKLIRCGSALVAIGLVAMAIVIPRGPIWLIVVVVVISNAGFGMMWGFIIKRVIGAAPKEEKDRASSLMPITQQTGFALGAAASGLIANGLGLTETSGVETISYIAFWLFAGFMPFALLGNIAAWRFSRD
jgi:MFS family permease